MKKITIEEKKNGYVVHVDGFIRVAGDYVYKSTAYLEMLEFIGEQVAAKKVEVREK